MLAGGLGLDVLTGGEGSDTFLFDTMLNKKANVDTITDFVAGLDRIGLDVTSAGIRETDKALPTTLVQSAYRENCA